MVCLFFTLYGDYFMYLKYGLICFCVYSVFGFFFPPLLVIFHFKEYVSINIICKLKLHKKEVREGSLPPTIFFYPFEALYSAHPILTHPLSLVSAALLLCCKNVKVQLYFCIYPS